jgi:crooked neck
MEEMLGNYNGAREVFNKWMATSPEAKAFTIFSKFEERVGNPDRSREVMYQLIQAHPVVQSFIKVARFEEKRKDRQSSRRVFEKAIEELGFFCLNEEFFLAFTDFEIRAHEYERARVLFKHAVDKLTKAAAPRLYQSYVNFEKQHGSKGSIEMVVVNKRRALYETTLASDPMKFDTWFDYIALEEAEGCYERVRETYERAIANVPPASEKRFWRRYQYFWIGYALFEENAGALDCARAVYEKALEIIPHQMFSFSKVWVNYALFEIRQKDIQKARKILGTAIGKCGSSKIFSAYIDLELQIGDIERCRKLHDKWLLTQPWNSEAWLSFIELEKNLEEHSRCEALFELAINTPELERPEVVWKAFIDFYTELRKFEQAREVYERLLKKTRHLKVWISYAKFEILQDSVKNARKILENAENFFKNSQNKVERAELLEIWKDIENDLGNEEEVLKIEKRMPRKVKKKRKLADDDDAAFEEYVDFIFPDEEGEVKSLKILEMAEKWKRGLN